ncbi:MAG: ribonuclease Z [Cryomorphaceae bacterium]|nr:ribonuclease Z [Cryomorphaceae bacterium]
MIATLHILGTSSAVPTSNRFPSSQLLDFGGELMLIDCGEGCQMQMRKQGIGFGRIRQIFISHAHGDHFFGLIGLLSTLSVLKVDQPLDIYAPPVVKKVIDYQLKTLGYRLRMKLHWHLIDPDFEGLLLNGNKCMVEAIKLNHSVPVHGFIFREKIVERNIDSEKISAYDLSVSEIVRAKKGKEVIREDGTVLSNEELTLPLHKPLTYAFCTDTTRVPRLDAIHKAHLLYHEATYLEKERELGFKTLHSTAKDAGMAAAENEVDQLLIGHFSARYKKTDKLLQEAREQFPNTTVAHEGMRIRIDSKTNDVRILT